MPPFTRAFSEALQAKLGTLSLEAQNKLEKDTAKKEAKAEAKADAALKKKMVNVQSPNHAAVLTGPDCLLRGNIGIASRYSQAISQNSHQ